MPFFTEQMEKLTNDLRVASHERATFVVHVQEQSDQLLGNLNKEHRAMSERLRESLATNRQERSAAVTSMREQNREHRQEMSKGLQEMLTQNCRQRQQEVADLRKAFHEAQAVVVSDVRQAGVVWRQRAQAPAAAPTHVKKHHRKAHHHA